jgi:hypothetical protein
MKAIFTRAIMVTALATSISAFAQSAEVKPDGAAIPTNVTQQTDCNRKANDAARQDEQKSQDVQKPQDEPKSQDEQKIEQKIEQQDKDWQHDLQGDYGV